MTTNTFVKSGDVIIHEGVIAPYAEIRFYLANTTTKMTVYQDAALSSPHTFPVYCDQYGKVPRIYINFTSYSYAITTREGAEVYSEPEQINPAPPSSGGGGGITVNSDMVAQTGDTKPDFCDSGEKDGWVRMNGRTIGNPASGATEKASTTTEALFAFYWAKFSQPATSSEHGFVSSGRGASAAADFAANKTIVLMDNRGITPIGSDTMGNTAANRSQVSTTISTTNGSASATVASASGLCVGQFCVSTNVPSGTTITVISGTTVTLSANATATASGTAARFSIIRDAQVVGSTGGVQTHTLSIPQIPLITPAGTLSMVPLGYYDPATIGGVGSAVPGYEANIYWRQGSFSNHAITGTFTGTQFGGGQPHNNIQPARVCTYYQKL